MSRRPGSPDSRRWGYHRLPAGTAAVLATYLQDFRQLRVNGGRGNRARAGQRAPQPHHDPDLGSGPSPHKICMLLAVLDLARAGSLAENRIEFGPELLDRYRMYFDGIKREGDHPNPHFPFFHLKSPLLNRRPGFWHLHPQPGREAILAAMGSPRSARDILENVSHVTLDPALHGLIQIPEMADALGQELCQYWFDRELSELRGMAGHAQAISRYERQLRLEPSRLTASDGAPPVYVRDPAFRRVVCEAYDYKCAATGTRIVLPDGTAMVEAAHLQPFAVAADDDPRNGIALTPDMHWALDQHLIAPDENLRWRVSPLVDDRDPQFRGLVNLAGRPLFLPGSGAQFPKLSSIRWLLSRLAGEVRTESLA